MEATAAEAEGVEDTTAEVVDMEGATEEAQNKINFGVVLQCQAELLYVWKSTQSEVVIAELQSFETVLAAGPPEHVDCTKTLTHGGRIEASIRWLRTVLVTVATAPAISCRLPGRRRTALHL